ncbi:hypothetical protein AAG570_005519 [Ranatra chinensis]|uniref:Uridine 5'-monophosphate synthase n=1 Tax=Ranatra chinensis TaxID=642074 RepID=A0ABD0YJE8_9HEMI
MQNFNEKLKGLCLKLHEIGALKFGDFKMKVGINSPVYFDLRVIVSHPTVLETLSSLMWHFIEQRELRPAVLCGVPYTALPITTIVAVKSRLPMLIRRKEPKNYGTMKLIEGKFSAGDECLIVEDVVTSGCSILETANDLRRDGLIVKDTVVVLDRMQGGESNLKNEGIRMHSLLTLNKVLNILQEAGKVDVTTCDKVKGYINDNQIFPDGRPKSKIQSKSRLTMSFADRCGHTKNELTKRLFTLFEKKRSNLCIAIDANNSEDLLKIVRSVGEHACIIKTHYDAILDWNENTESSLIALAKQYDFLIMEDRKFGDIGNTVAMQCTLVFRWADLVTVHPVAGPGAIDQKKGVFLIAEFSSKASLISPHYTKTTGGFCVTHGDILVGLVCHSPTVIPHPGLIQFTPEVSVKQVSDGAGDSCVSLEDAILVKGADVVAVGRTITHSADPQLAARTTRDKLWEAYLQRISHN